MSTDRRVVDRKGYDLAGQLHMRRASDREMYRRKLRHKKAMRIRTLFYGMGYCVITLILLSFAFMVGRSGGVL